MSSAADGGQPARLVAATHWRVEPPFAADAPDWLSAVALAGRLCGEQLAQAMQASRFQPDTVLVLSTLMPFTVTASGAALQAFNAAVQARSGQRPSGILNAYLCAGWGYALRHLMRLRLARKVALLIADVDLHDLAWNLEHPVIGRSGFGTSVLLLELPAAEAHLPGCSGPHPNSAFNEVMLALRAHQARHGVVPTFIPFLQGPLAAQAERLLAPGSLGRNRHAEYGHCFGADPWIGVIDWCAGAAAAQRPAGPQRVLLGAVAFNGYCTWSALDLAPAPWTAFKTLDGAWATLHAAAGGAGPARVAPSLRLQPSTLGARTL